MSKSKVWGSGPKRPQLDAKPAWSSSVSEAMLKGMHVSKSKVWGSGPKRPQLDAEPAWSSSGSEAMLEGMQASR